MKASHGWGGCDWVDAAAYRAASWTRRAVDLEAVALGWGLGGGHAEPRTWRRRRTCQAGEAEQQGKVKASMAARLKASRKARLSRGWQGGESQSRNGSAVKAGRVVL